MNYSLITLFSALDVQTIDVSNIKKERQKFSKAYIMFKRLIKYYTVFFSLKKLFYVFS